MAGPQDSDVVLIQKVRTFVEQYMSNYDGSHDFSHSLRVLAHAQRIATSAPELYNPLVVTLAALMHDVGDKKYLKPGEDASTLVQITLTELGADEGLATKVQAIVTGVSFSFETKHPSRVTELIAQHPELAVVQDADRLDAIGAIGIGRAFTYGGAAGGSTRGKEMGETIDHFTDKLERLQGMMKTEVGKETARERTRRLEEFRGWWTEEMNFLVS